MFAKHIVEHEGADGSRRRFFNFTGVGVEALVYPEMEGRINRWIADKSSRSHHVACLNAYCVALSARNARLREIYNKSDLAAADGMPFVRWIQRVMKTPCDRLSGPELVLYLAERSEETGYTFFLYGGAPEVLERARAYLEGEFPHIRILGTHSPPFRELTPEEDGALTSEMNRLRPDIVIVCLGTPKQDYWIDAHVERLRGSVLIASGAAVDFFGGRVKRAPGWVSRYGFEWLYRLFGKDFRRLWKRYTYYNLLFVSRFVLQMSGVRRYPFVVLSRDTT
jgi:N-acetylglucosaminyldiphosphoundecaprenol N-acetyl-beta-D-mannosaminyltransferase